MKKSYVSANSLQWQQRYCPSTDARSAGRVTSELQNKQQAMLAIFAKKKTHDNKSRRFSSRNFQNVPLIFLAHVPSPRSLLFSLHKSDPLLIPASDSPVPSSNARSTSAGSETHERNNQRPQAKPKRQNTKRPKGKYSAIELPQPCARAGPFPICALTCLFSPPL